MASRIKRDILAAFSPEHVNLEVVMKVAVPFAVAGAQDGVAANAGVTALK